MIVIDTTIKHVPTSTLKTPMLVFHSFSMMTEPVVEITPSGKTVFSEEEVLTVLFPDAKSKNELRKAIRKQHGSIKGKIRVES